VPNLGVVSAESIPFATGGAPVIQRQLMIHGIRSGLIVAVFFLAIVFQLMQGAFLSPAIWLPVYGVLVLAFFANSAYFLAAEKCQDAVWVHAGLFAMDAVVITYVVHHTGSSQSLFFFLYLVEIILAALIFGRRGAYTQALWTSLLFGLLLLTSPQALGESVYFLATFNNLAFFTVAYLGAQLSEQINFMGRELKRTVKSLEALQDLNRHIVENVATGLLTVDSSGQILTANPAAVKILDGVMVVGLPLQNVFPRLNLAGNVVWLHSQQSAVQRHEVEFLNRHREKLQLEVLVSPLKDDRGHNTGFVLMFQDRTEVRRLEESMKQKEKMAAVGQLAAGIAHEIRNPLASLSGSVQLMSASPEKYSAEDVKLMRIITREIDRLNNLITEFLEFVKPEARPTEMVDLNAILREVLEVLQFNNQLRKDVKNVIELKAECRILGRRDKLKQAFLNIVINSIQAMEETEKPVLELETFDQPGRVVLVVKDNGRGMDEATRARIFEPFFTTKPKGTGLGLAVTHKILENHGAQVNVVSRVGEGTTMTLDFPGERDSFKGDLPGAREA
jgi:two-component system, NtrC family, sensor histidine kinase PilS